jgi:hypothetical protein
MKWDENSISICESFFLLLLRMCILRGRYAGSFYRAAIPKDIIAGTPNPSLWGLPSATLLNTKCNITDYFWSHAIVFGAFPNRRLQASDKLKNDSDITFCGQLPIHCVFIQTNL